MQTAKGNLFTRDDTFFGVCEALGQDLRFNPLPLRLALGIGVLWNPVVVLATYAALAVMVLASRLLFPAPRPAPAPAAAQQDGPPAMIEAEPEFALAA